RSRARWSSLGSSRRESPVSRATCSGPRSRSPSSPVSSPCQHGRIWGVDLSLPPRRGRPRRDATIHRTSRRAAVAAGRASERRSSRPPRVREARRPVHQRSDPRPADRRDHRRAPWAQADGRARAARDGDGALGGADGRGDPAHRAGEVRRVDVERRRVPVPRRRKRPGSRGPRVAGLRIDRRRPCRAGDRDRRARGHEPRADLPDARTFGSSPACGRAGLRCPHDPRAGRGEVAPASPQRASDGVDPVYKGRDDRGDHMPPHRNAYRPSVMGTRGVVTSAHPLASMAGIQILLAGGNAVDAAVAVRATLHVVEPFMSSAGGIGLMLISRGRERHVLDFIGRSPAASDPAACTDDELVGGPKSCATPGNLGGWLAALERFGSMDRARVLAPAISLAENGVPLTFKNVEFFEAARETLARSPEAQRLYLGNGGPRPGRIVTYKELASTFRQVAEGGPEVFYRGPIARAVA